MTGVIVGILAVVWTIYGVLWWRGREETRPGRSIVSFNEHLQVLGRAKEFGPVVAGATPGGGTWSQPERVQTGADWARRRRQEVLKALGVAALVTLLLALGAGGVFVGLHLLVDLSLAAYVTLLVRMRRNALEQRSKVILLPAVVAGSDDDDGLSDGTFVEPLLSRSGS